MFKCQFDKCENQYLYLSSLKKHQARAHNVEYNELVEEKNALECGYFEKFELNH